MTSERLPMVRTCGDCSRRSVLRGIGAAAVGALILDAGCQQQGSSLPTANSSSCGAARCIDLGDAANQELEAVGGAMLIESAGDTIMVVRTSDSQVVALSAICTHQRCLMDYNAGQNRLDCGCHGSQFSITGGVVRGPANRPLRVYAVTLSNNVVTITT